MGSKDDQLKTLRRQIDALDEKILQLLSQRIDTVRKVGHYKQEHHLPLLDACRWKDVVETRSARAKTLGLSPDFAAELYDLIHKYALAVEAEENDLS